ncbi:MAG: lipid-binding SYLF domain-containing protein [Gammaproteobacteria bacterium]
MNTFHQKKLFLFLIAVYLFGSAAISAETIDSKENTIVALADEVLRDILTIPERSIPPALLAQAQAIAIIPEVIKFGLVLGGSFGEGVILMKNRHTHSWSDPVFLTLKGGSLGLQIGAQSSDLILVFKNKRGLADLMHGEFTLGAGASVAAGPVGRNASAATDVKLQAEIMSYSRSRGLFAGISLEGASLDINNAANAAFYNRNEISPRQIFNGEVRSPRATQPLKNSLREHASQ